MRDASAIARQYTPPTDYPTKLAHRILLSNLAHLETIAVEAARRGDGVDGQLDDELFHREVFRACANATGAMTEPDEATSSLIDYLQSLEGADSIHILNIVAEGWLETVFHHLAKVVDFIPNVFRMIEEDEHRHHEGAKGIAPKAGEKTGEIVREVEERLFKIANSANFMLPLVRVLGKEAASRMGHDLAVSHEQSCIHLGVIPRVSRLKALARNGRLLTRKEPVPVPDRPWDEIKKRLWRDSVSATQHAFVDIIIPDHVRASDAVVQARLCRALAVVYQQYPQTLRVYRNGVTYEPQSIVLGLRMAHKDRDQVGTIFFNPTKYLTDRRLIRMLNRRKRRMNEKDYEGYPDVRYLEPLLYPSYAVATVSSNGAYGGDFGAGPLNDLEGIGTSYTIGRIRYRHKEPSPSDRGKLVLHSHVEAYFTLCVAMDHRIGDGKDIGDLARGVKEQFERATFS